MATNLLEIGRRVCAAISLPRPTAIMSASDNTAQRLRALAIELGHEMAAEGDWHHLQTEAVFSTVADQEAYALSTIAPGFKRMLSDTLRNRTRRDTVAGAATPQIWQDYKAWSTVGTIPRRFRVLGVSLKLQPIPTAVETLAFEYVTGNWCTTAGGVGQDEWAADADLPVLPVRLWVLGLKYAMLKDLGMDYAKAEKSYRDAISQELGGTAAPKLSLTNPGASYRAQDSLPDAGWSSW